MGASSLSTTLVVQQSFDVMASARDCFRGARICTGNKLWETFRARYGLLHMALAQRLFSPRTARSCHGLFRDTL